MLIFTQSPSMNVLEVEGVFYKVENVLTKLIILSLQLFNLAPFLLFQVWEAADVLIKAALPLTTSDTKTVSEWISQMATLPQASNLATRILLLTLLFEVRFRPFGPCYSFIKESSNTQHLRHCRRYREMQDMSAFHEPTVSDRL